MNKTPINPIKRHCLTAFKFIVTAILLAIGSSLSVPAQDIVSLKFTSPKAASGSFPGDNWMFGGDYAGAPGVRTNNWNNLMASSDGSASSITLPAGSISNAVGNIVANLQVVYVSPASKDGVYEWTVGTTNDHKLYGTGPDAYGNSGFSQYGYLDITNIPYTNYNIYVYNYPGTAGSGSSNTRGGFWAITNTPTGTNRIYFCTQTNDGSYTAFSVPSTSGAGYVQATTTAIAPGAAWTGIQGGTYGVFTGLTNSWTRLYFSGLGNGSGAKDDLGNYVTGGSTAVRFNVSGIQIVQVNLGAATNLLFGPSTNQLHAGNPGGTQSILQSVNASGVTNTVTGTNYISSNTNVVQVSAIGLLTPGTNGTAQVIGYFQGLTATDTVTVIGPTSLSISVANTNLLSGNGQGVTTTASLLATFSDATNVPVNGYQFTSFSGSASVTAQSNGTLKAVSPGYFSVTGNYDGLSVTTNNVGLVSAWANPISVPAMSIHFTGPSESMLFHDLSGYPGARAGYWNNFVQNTGNVTNQLNNPTDDQGNVLNSTVVQMIPNYGGTLYNQSLDLLGGITTNESVLFGDCFDLGMNNGTTVQSELIVSNVPYATYDVYFYIWNDTANTNRPAEFTIDGVTQYRNNSAAYPSQPGNTGTGYVIAAPQPGSLPASIVDVPYGNVVKFAGVTDSNLTVQIASIGQDLIGDANAVTRVRLAGFQIVPSLDGLNATNIYLTPAVVPAQLPGNPATYGLTLLANFSNGTLGGNITALPGVTYVSSNTNVFEVDTNGNVTPGLTPGTATLTITYQTNTLNTTVTNLAPISERVVPTPNTVYLNSILGAQPAQASLLVTFPGNTNVNVSSFNSVSFVDQGAAAATMSSSGAITANAVGQANLGASFLGTTYVTANAFNVLNTGGAPTLEHQYNFTDPANSSTVVDAIGGANGTVYAPLSTNKPITLDGARAIFPGDGDYSIAPYIALPAGIIDSMGDVSIEMWGGQSQLNVWARFFGFGSTPKGTNPHVLGGTATSGLQLLASYAGTGKADFYPFGLGDFEATAPLTNGVEYQFVTVYAPNAGVLNFYVNGALVASGSPTNSYLSTFVNDTVDWLGVSLSNGDAPLAGWINNLAIYEGVLSSTQVASDYAAGQSVYLPPVTVATNSVPVTFSVSSGNLNLSWPPDHQGWQLQAQTNSLSTGLGTNWVTVPGSASVTNEVIPIGPANGAVFYRLFYQP